LQERGFQNQKWYWVFAHTFKGDAGVWSGLIYGNETIHSAQMLIIEIDYYSFYQKLEPCRKFLKYKQVNNPPLNQRL